MPATGGARQSTGKLPKKPQPKGGSRKGKPNKVTATIKEMILGALDAVGGQAYLEMQAWKEPRAFLGLIGKIMPLQVTGADGAPLIPETDPSKLAQVILGLLHTKEGR